MFIAIICSVILNTIFVGVESQRQAM